MPVVPTTAIAAPKPIIELLKLFIVHLLPFLIVGYLYSFRSFLLSFFWYTRLTRQYISLKILMRELKHMGEFYLHFHLFVFLWIDRQYYPASEPVPHVGTYTVLQYFHNLHWYEDRIIILFPRQVILSLFQSFAHILEKYFLNLLFC